MMIVSKKIAAEFSGNNKDKTSTGNVSQDGLLVNSLAGNRPRPSETAVEMLKLCNLMFGPRAI